MSKKLEDYIHLYLGCKCVNSWFSEEHKEYNKGWTLMGIVRDSDKQYGLETGNEYTWTDSIKPILRKLDSITDEEWNQIEPQLLIPDAWGYYGIRDNFIKRIAAYRFDWAIVNEALVLLRKMSIDVDQLIDAGLAIDANTLK